MVNFELPLNGSWKFKGFPECNGEDLKVFRLDYNDTEWLTGNVPGTVQTDLIENNVIPDPFANLNEEKVKWVPQQEWWYRKQIDLSPELLDRQAVELIFDGLDTFASVWMNGEKVGEANNMFTSWHFSIKSAIRTDRNVIAVCFKPIYKVASELESKYGEKYGSLHVENFSGRPYVRKAQYSFGWDWGPTLPTAGIWRTAKIIAFDKAKLDYLSILPLEVSAEKAKIKALVDVHGPSPYSVKGKFIVEGFGQRIEKEVSKSIASGQSCLEADFEIANPHLWWPRGYGEPNLYNVSIELFCDDVLCEKAMVKSGIRSVKLLQKPDDEGESFIFLINGLPVFCKGACWIPADSFLPRVTTDRYQKLLVLSAEANFNMLRVWGGGVYEDDFFYNLCDNLGIMVWQDFMYACCAYPEDEWFLKEAEREADEVVRRLRGHACIVVWCGNNEIQWQYKTVWNDMPKLFGLSIWEKILPNVIAKLDGSRPYRSSTPYSDGEINSEHEGNRHNWVVWSKQVDYPAYLDDNGRFLSEFGWQASPTFELLKQYLGSADLNLESPALEAHEKQVNGLKILSTLLALHYPIPQNLQQFTLYSQLNQADALKTAVIHWRSRMFRTSGCLIWQLNDCWPVISWSLIDYGLNPKPAYYVVKRAFQPIIASLIVKDDKVYCYIVNETSNSADLALRFEVLTFNGEHLYEENKKIKMPTYTSLLVFESSLEKLSITDDCTLTVSLEQNGRVIFEDSKTIKEPKNLSLPKAPIKITVKKVETKTFEIILQSPVYAKAVNIILTDKVVRFSDNFFDLIPNKKKSVKCQLEEEMSAADFAKKIKCLSYPFN